MTDANLLLGYLDARFFLGGLPDRFPAAIPYYIGLAAMALGLIVLASFISPFRSERRMARELMATGEFIEVFVDTPLEVCMTRDPKGLYEKARAGTIKNFTGIDSPYEAPEQAEITLKTIEASAQAQAEKILRYLHERAYI